MSDDIGPKSAQLVFLTTQATKARVDALCALFGASRGGILNPALAAGLPAVERMAAEQFGEGWEALAEKALRRAARTRTQGRGVGVPPKAKAVGGRAVGKPSGKRVGAA